MISSLTTAQQETLQIIMDNIASTLSHPSTGEANGKISGLHFEPLTGKLHVTTMYGYESDDDPMDLYVDVIYPDGSRHEVERYLNGQRAAESPDPNAPSDDLAGAIAAWAPPVEPDPDGAHHTTGWDLCAADPPACTSDDPNNHQGDTCPVHEPDNFCDHCGEDAGEKLYHNDTYGGSLCERCDRWWS